MRSFSIRPAKSVRRKVAATLLGALVVVALTLAVSFAGVQPDFGIAAAPSSQTVTAGGSTTYSIAVTRSGGYAGAVALSAAGLPAGATATFSPASVTTSQTSSTMTVSTTSATPAGSYKITISGAGSGKSSTAQATLVVQPAQQPNFTVSASPASQTVLVNGDDVTYDVTIARSGGFTGPVTLAASGVPAKTDAAFSPATVPSGQTTSNLTLTTTDKSKPDVYSVTISGQGGGLTRTAAVTLSVQPSADFSITGNAETGKLAPGISRPVDPLLSNPNAKALSVTSLNASITALTAPGACPLSDFSVAPASSALFPVRLVANAGPTALSTLAQASHPTWTAAQVRAALPMVSMLNRPANQNGCKNATLAYKYVGSAGKG
jgi:hypothetical protein